MTRAESASRRFDQLCFDVAAAAFCPVADRVARPATATPSLAASFHASASWPADRGRNQVEIGTVERRLEQFLGTLFTDGLTSGEASAGEEDLLVEAETRAPDEDQPGDRDGEGLVEVRARPWRSPVPASARHPTAPTAAAAWRAGAAGLPRCM